jgi:chloramphenicol O-acetyltransferase type B
MINIPFIKDAFKDRSTYQIGEYSYAFGMPVVRDWNQGTKLVIGKFCSVSPNVQILLGGNHRSDWVTTYPFPNFFAEAIHLGSAGFSKGDVVIGNDVWIGLGAIILSGVTIGDGAILAAHAVVTRDVAPYSIVAGNPSRQIKKRFPDKQIARLLEIRWWDWPFEKIRENFDLICSPEIEVFLEKHSNHTLHKERNDAQ